MSSRTRLARSRPALALAWAWCMAGCEVDLNRMSEQPSFGVYDPSRYFADGTIMRHPPAGTVPRARPLLAPEVRAGVEDGAVLARVPVDVTEALLARGQNRYEIFCATCHGSTGMGETQVGENMQRRPPPLVLPPVRDYPAGRIYRAVAEGYGLMRAYDAELPVLDRWAVVAYVQALQLGHAIALDALPPDMQTEARSWLQ